ncbi:hypothetical protein BN946_scf185033.g3 [Trametes cinnabarina]|uniref:Transposase family Tnp2 protein n=1 Tax=Pycnoporus cinnabarinus TaxID=5643 RepID=A0A060SRQ3_PYCCI|nr:hypothetical protein BN946_scf185033.g3 [Trametes cinnabarina]
MTETDLSPSRWQRRYPCPCRECRGCGDPADGMQTRQTIRRHAFKDAQADQRTRFSLSKTVKRELILAEEDCGLGEKTQRSTASEEAEAARAPRRACEDHVDTLENSLGELKDAVDSFGHLSDGSSGNTLCDIKGNSDGRRDATGLADEPLDNQDDSNLDSEASDLTLEGIQDRHYNDNEDYEAGDFSACGGSIGLQRRAPHCSVDLDSSSSDDSVFEVQLDGASEPRIPRHCTYIEDVEEDEDLLAQCEVSDNECELPDQEGAVDVAEDDPLYARLQDLLSYQDLPVNSYANGDLPPAFAEDPLIRQYQNYSSLSRCADFNIPGLGDMARTLRTVERRLGVDPDTHIVYYALCTKCWARVSPSELIALPHSSCTKPGCTGKFYDVKTTVDGRKHRIPLKPLPTTSLIAAVQRMLMRPGKVDELNVWRVGPDDKSGPSPPVSQEEWPGTGNDTFRMNDLWDGWGWRAVQAGLERRKGGQWGFEDVAAFEHLQHFVALPLGLILMFNIDWFRGMKQGKYSVGAIYCTICNNPRAKRFLREETILLAIIPGPEEPSLEELNSVLEIFVMEARRLYDGISMRLPSMDEPQPCHAYVNIVSADLPGSRNATGLCGHTAERFMCPVCKKSLTSLVDHTCYDPSTYQYRDDNRYLKYAFRARFEDQATRDEIAERRGVRWSILNILPDWLPSRDSPPDFMHGGYLGEAKHVVQGILIKGGMFTKRSNTNRPLERFKSFLEDVWLPGTFRRVPINLLTGAAGKADQWRILVTYLPVALYASWNINGSIPDIEAPQPNAREKAAAEQEHIAGLVNVRRHRNALTALQDGNIDLDDLDGMADDHADRNYVRHFEAVLERCVAMRICGSQSISVEEAWRAHECHMYACQAWARMLCHLTPYFHILMHLILWILRLGPVYAWWVFAYERFNGYLSKIRHNGHPGELEATMMRGWTKMHLIYDLILHLENLGEMKTQEDEDSIKDLKECLQGPGKTGNNKGTLLAMLAAMTAHHNHELIVYPKHGRKIDLKHAGIYPCVYEHLRKEWKDRCNLVPDTASRAENGTAFVAVAIPAFSHVVVAGVRYGASTAQRGLNCRAADLGIDTWKARRLGDAQVINVTQFLGQFALATIEHRGRELWITMSLCRDSQEPDRVDEVQDDDW